jgi:hypothetical protein
MMSAGILKPRLAGAVDADRLIVDLAPDLARDDVGVDESRAGVTVRGRASPWGIVDDMSNQALPGQIRDRLVRRDGAASRGREPCVLPAEGKRAGTSKRAKAAATAEGAVSWVLLRGIAISLSR